MRLKDRVAIVTGAARDRPGVLSGPGARSGARMVAADMLGCDETVAQVRATSADLCAVSVDVTDELSTEAMAAQTLRAFGRIDILINNAALYGGLQATPFEQIAEPEWDEVMSVNVKGIWHCCRTGESLH